MKNKENTIYSIISALAAISMTAQTTYFFGIVSFPEYLLFILLSGTFFIGAIWFFGFLRLKGETRVDITRSSYISLILFTLVELLTIETILYLKYGIATIITILVLAQVAGSITSYYLLYQGGYFTGTVQA